MSERAGVEIDWCPDGRRVRLDRGELDEILDRAEQETRSAPVTASPSAPAAPLGGCPDPVRDDRRRDDDRDRDRSSRSRDRDRSCGSRDDRRYVPGGCPAPGGIPQGGGYGGTRRTKESSLSELIG
jgi:Zn-finger nucleic acid-binding protein